MELITREYFKQFDIEHFWPPHMSVLITSLGRPEYVKECVESIHKYADVPTEIIIADDGSPIATQKKILELSDKVSTIVFNTGYNVGFGRNLNRARNMATGKYLIIIPDDNFITSSFFKRMKYALDKPYVGIVCITNSSDKPLSPDKTKNVHKLPDGSQMCLGGFEPNVYGVRTNVCDEVGNWNSNVQTHGADSEFCGSVFAAGYFIVRIEGLRVNCMFKRSEDGKTTTSEGNPSYIGCTTFSHEDCNTPKFFIKDKAFDTKEYLEINKKRYGKIWEGTNYLVRDNHFAPVWSNIHFTCTEITKLGREEIDWEFAKVYRHNKWKDMIIKDFNQ